MIRQEQGGRFIFSFVANPFSPSTTYIYPSIDLSFFRSDWMKMRDTRKEKLSHLARFTRLLSWCGGIFVFITSCEAQVNDYQRRNYPCQKKVSLGCCNKINLVCSSMKAKKGNKKALSSLRILFCSSLSALLHFLSLLFNNLFDDLADQRILVHQFNLL